ncbi:TIGR02530 family flagellar biosynthesis protein [Solibacillus sp. NPDC093137]|uniref:TIGR02530 family flagellar biosynthesis protein n=1 Tax=Solibacillus sp. NPDC093137 TaxID=3390678 RepID=UPI003D07B5F9
MNRVNIQHIPYHPPIKPMVKQSTEQVSKQSFMDHLKQATGDELKISKHASERLNERNISITDREWQQISKKVFEAKDKGVKQPLVLLDQAALIVSAKNATVITALDRNEAKQQLFTNIDGTILI